MRLPMRKLTKAERERLDRGRCPIHGIGLTQIGGFYYRKDGSEATYKGSRRNFTLVGCPRKECEFTATAKRPSASVNPIHWPRQ